MPVRGDRNETMTVNVQELKRISFDLISGGMSDDLGRDLSRKIIVFNAFSLIGILNLVLLGTLAYLQRNPWLAALDYCAAFVLACLIVYLRRTKDYKTAFYCGVGVVGVLYYYLLFTGGVNNTAHVWYFTFPLIASFILGSRTGLAATLLMLVPAVAFFMWENPPSPFTTYSRDFKLRFIPSFLVITAFAYFFERTREKATMRLEGVNAELKSAVSALQETEEKLRKAGEQLEQRVRGAHRAALPGEPPAGRRDGGAQALRGSAPGERGQAQRHAPVRRRQHDHDRPGPEHRLVQRQGKRVVCPRLRRQRNATRCCAKGSGPANPIPATRSRRSGTGRSTTATRRSRPGRAQEAFFHCVANVALRDAKADPTAVLTILRDITDRKLAENAVMESEKKYRTLFEDSVEAMSISRNGRMIDANPAWLALHGYRDKGEVLGRDVMEFIHPEDRHILAERREAWPHHDCRSYQIRDIRRDGDIVDIEICASRIALVGQEAILTTIRDITEKRQNEREKKALEERLARSEKMEAIGTLAGGVAHDLNNILGGMVGYPDLLLMEVPEEGLLRRGILTIKQSGEKAAAIVQDLLTLARRGVPVMEPVEPEPHHHGLPAKPRIP